MTKVSLPNCVWIARTFPSFVTFYVPSVRPHPEGSLKPTVPVVMLPIIYASFVVPFVFEFYRMSDEKGFLSVSHFRAVLRRVHNLIRIASVVPELPHSTFLCMTALPCMMVGFLKPELDLKPDSFLFFIFFVFFVFSKNSDPTQNLNLFFFSKTRHCPKPDFSVFWAPAQFKARIFLKEPNRAWKHKI